jgi:hypothetical protein
MGRLTVRRGGLIRLALLALSWGSSFVWIKHGTGNAAGARRRPAPRLRWRFGDLCTMAVRR